ncbi:aquaporin [Mycena leptocephala]|nr:aquaporin [Mycena leptocephala]
MSKAPDGMSTNDSGSKDENSTEHIENYAGHDNITIHPNAWSRYRLMMRDYAAEFLGEYFLNLSTVERSPDKDTGVCILIIFGTGVDCQVVLSSVTGVASSQKGSYLSISFGWAIGTAMGVWVSGGISGGHINPAVTIAMATYRGFPWKKVPGYIAAQTLGGLVGAGLVYANYYHAINIFEGGPHVRTLATASLQVLYLRCVFPRGSSNPDLFAFKLNYMTSVSCFFSEFLATAVLLVVVLAINDKKNMPPPAGLAPLVLFILILGIGACLGMETAYAINPARDLGPRLLTSMVGYGKQVYTYRKSPLLVNPAVFTDVSELTPVHRLWCPIIAPILGAQAGCMFYDAFLYTGEESPFNKPNAAARAHHQHAIHQMRKNLPAGPGAEDHV